MTTQLNQRINMAAAVLKQFGAKGVYIFGSAATDSMREDSDIDLAVEGLPPAMFFGAMSRAGEALGRTLDLVDLDDPNPFTRYLRTEGKLVRVA